MEKKLNNRTMLHSRLLGIPFNIVDLFFQSAEKYPDNIAIIEKDKEVTFAELKNQVKETSAYLLHKGIRKGDRVMIFVPMSTDLYRIVLALFNIGATAVFLDEWVSKERMEKCCEIARCKAFIGGFKIRMLAIFSKELRKIPIKLGLNYKQIKQEDYIRPDVNKSDTALITFTTGSTGTPKAAKRTHGFLQEQFNALLEKIDPQADDIDMPVLPIVLLINLGVGCTSVIAKFNTRKPASIKERDIISQIKKHKVNRLVASPFFVKRLSEYIISNNQLVSTVDKIFTGGAPVFPHEAKIYNQAFPNTKIEIVYGSTEAEPISAIDVKSLINKNILEKGLNVGMPYRKTKVKIIKYVDEPIACATEEKLNERQLRGREPGEIIVSGSHVLREYLNNEEALLRNKIFIGDDCWHRTGDSGYRGENGELFLTGRCNTLITSNGEVIAPFIFENYFQSLEGVEMGTILEMENKILAVIELNNSKGKEVVYEEIINCDSRIADVLFIREIPRDPRHHSKIDYGRLERVLGKTTY